MDYQEQLAAIASVLKEGKSQSSSKPDFKANEETLSIARKVTNMVTRENKAELWLDTPLQPFVGRLVALITDAQSDPQDSIDSRSELDNHAKMNVVGSECVVFDDTGKTCTVNYFAKSAGNLDDVKIFDAAVAYDCPYKCKTYILLMIIILHVPELRNNLIPPFIMREGGISVDECPKPQASSPSLSNHSIYLRTQTSAYILKWTAHFHHFQQVIKLLMS